MFWRGAGVGVAAGGGRGVGAVGAGWGRARGDFRRYSAAWHRARAIPGRDAPGSRRAPGIWGSAGGSREHPSGPSAGERGAGGGAGVCLGSNFPALAQRSFLTPLFSLAPKTAAFCPKSPQPPCARGSRAPVSCFFRRKGGNRVSPAALAVPGTGREPGNHSRGPGLCTRTFTRVAARARVRRRAPHGHSVCPAAPTREHWHARVRAHLHPRARASAHTHTHTRM